MPDQRLGEKACAVVVVKDGRDLTLADIQQFLTGRQIARQKIPEQRVTVAALPRTASGKTQKFLLREQLAEREMRPAPAGRPPHRPSCRRDHTRSRGPR